MLVRLALAVLLATGCRSSGLVGQLCDAADCRPTPPCEGAGCTPLCDGAPCSPDPCPLGICPAPACEAGECAPAACDGGRCAQPGCEGGSCAPGACEAGVCAPSCDGGSCDDAGCSGGGCAAPSCDGGICQAGSCDGGACQPDPGCNGTFPICATCQSNLECAGDNDEPYCDQARGSCVECLAAVQCGTSEPYCVEGECEECRDDDDCPSAIRCRDGDCGID